MINTYRLRLSIWLATCLLVTPACARQANTSLKTAPAPTIPLVSEQPTHIATLPTALLVLPTQTETTSPLQTAIVTQSQAEQPPKVDIQTALRHIQVLSEEIGPRPAGTSQEVKAAQYIETIFRDLGYQTNLQPFTFSSRNSSNNSANVVAVKDGRSARTIIVGAHYDSIEVGKGADDNASGVAVMLAVAAMVKDRQTPFTVRFVAFGAEEAGLFGSSHYVQKMSAGEIQKTVSMINLDSLIAGNTLNVYGDSYTDRTLRNWLLQYARSQGLDLRTQPVENLDKPDGSPCNCADYSAFKAVGIPFAYFEATDWTLGDKDGWTQVDEQFGKNGEIWNTRFDYLDYINQNFPGRVEQHLDLFVRLLLGALTEFTGTD